jgi:uncharacterized membrane protein YgcG
MPRADREETTEITLGDTAPAVGEDAMAARLLQGLSWSWELDFEGLLAALNVPAPWNRPVRNTGLIGQPGVADADVVIAPSVDPGAVDEANAARPVGSDADAAAVGDASDGHVAGDTRVGSVAGSEDSAVGVENSAASDSVAECPAGDAAYGMDSADADLAEYLEAVQAGRTRQMPLSVVAGRVAETLPVGPALAGWLATSSADELEDGALAGVATSFRRLASWAQAGELAAVAQIASRSAAADDKIGVNAEGRPVRMPDEACAQVSLALAMSQCGASWWTDLAITLRWRLAATGAALRSGEIDLSRARLIAEATGPLDEDTARAVEARVLPAAGDQTTGQLRVALRRAVIAADPEGAERRRREAERRAKVSLYPDQEGTASLAGYSLPGTRAAAAMARISALARAMKSSGAGGGIDLLRAQVFLGLLLGTLPYIPPGPDSPPDDGPADPYEGPADPDDEGSGGAGFGGAGSGGAGAGSGGAGAGSGGAGAGSGGAGAGSGGAGSGGAGAGSGGAGAGSGGAGSGGAGAGDPGPVGPDPDCGDENDLDDSWLPAADLTAGGGGDENDSWPDPRPAPAWPDVKPFLLPAPPAMGNLRPGSGGLLDLTLPWSALAGDSTEPGYLSRLGPITPVQARHLADLAADDPAVQWRIILTSPAGHALAVTRIPRANVRAGPQEAADDPEVCAGLVGRVTLTISNDILSRPPPAATAPITTRALRAAARAAAGAAEQATSDAIADGGCAHAEASAAYRPPPRLRELVTARDVTCRFPTCRQPVWRCDLDHTIPYGSAGGRTCACNLGGLCRSHHQLKQHLHWKLTQSSPGHFEWITPSGRAYATGPDSHPL